MTLPAPLLTIRLLTGGLRLYQWTVRPLIPGCCRFEPGCSEYAVEALRIHGAARGSALAAYRVLRCNPFCDGGYDPVPPCGCGIDRQGRALPESAKGQGPLETHFLRFGLGRRPQVLPPGGGTPAVPALQVAPIPVSLRRSPV